MKLDVLPIQEFAYIAVITLAVLLGIGVFLSDKKSTQNRLYSLVALSIIGWIGFGHLIYNPFFADYITLLGRLNLAFFSIWCVVLYSFIFYFPKQTRPWNIIDSVFISIGMILAFLSSSSKLIVAKIEIIQSNVVWNMGILENLLYLYATIVALLIIYRLIKKFRNFPPEDRAKIKLFVYGIGCVLLFNIIFNIFYPTYYNRDDLYWLGDQSVVFLLGFTAYAITKFRMFNIKLIAVESVVIILSLILFIEIFISSSLSRGLINSLIWVLATYGGYQLVKSVRVEIKQREQLAELAQKLEKANDHLKEIDKLKDDFLSMASHELNTPIAAIQGYLSMILVEKMAGVIPPKAKKYLDSVFTSSQRLAHMVKDLLNVSRIESNRIHLIYEEKQIEDVIEQAVTEVMSKAREAKHALTFEKPKTKIPKTWFDVTRITEIIINILGNAIKYTDPGGKITARVMHDEDKIVVSVEDNGRGIPKDKQNTVFEKFSQVDVLKDQVKGTGLGMYISKKFIELHNGKIWFHSEGEGKGTTFFFSLPILTKKPYDAHAGEDSVLH